MTPISEPAILLILQQGLDLQVFCERREHMHLRREVQGKAQAREHLEEGADSHVLSFFQSNESLLGYAGFKRQFIQRQSQRLAVQPDPFPKSIGQDLEQFVSHAKKVSCKFLTA